MEDTKEFADWMADTASSFFIPFVQFLLWQSNAIHRTWSFP